MPVASEWGRDVTALVDPVSVASEWGVDSTALDAGPLGSSASEWGTASAVLNSPVPSGASPWGRAAATLHDPHSPIGVMTATGVEFVPIRSWNGTAWV